jgi:hypothetical protein
MNASAICKSTATVSEEYIFSVRVDISIPVVLCKLWQTGMAHNNASQLLSFLYLSLRYIICAIYRHIYLFFSWEPSDKQAERAKDNRYYANTKSNSF